jgi:hypothetical protein
MILEGNSTPLVTEGAKEPSTAKSTAAPTAEAITATPVDATPRRLHIGVTLTEQSDERDVALRLRVHSVHRRSEVH